MEGSLILSVRYWTLLEEPDKGMRSYRNECYEMISEERKGTEAVTFMSLSLCVFACVRVRLTESCAGGQ